MAARVTPTHSLCLASVACRLCPAKVASLAIVWPGPSEWPTDFGGPAADGEATEATATGRAPGLERPLIENTVVESFPARTVVNSKCHAFYHDSITANEAPVDTEVKVLPCGSSLFAEPLWHRIHYSVLSRKRGDSWQQPRNHKMVVRMTNRQNRRFLAGIVDFRLQFGRTNRPTGRSSLPACNGPTRMARNGSEARRR